ncbi:UNVERIFIED_CONTAM: hypothetical protein HDU68_009579, partial [Siphonaria sp. JEL0065]
MEDSEDMQTFMANLAAKSRALSALKYKDVQAYAPLNLPISLAAIANYVPVKARLPFNVLQEMYKGLKNASGAYGILSAAQRESLRRPFIDAILSPLLALFPGRVKNDTELMLDAKGNDANWRGKVEYLLRLNDNCMFMIIEAKCTIDKISSYGQ